MSFKFKNSVIGTRIFVSLLGVALIISSVLSILSSVEMANMMAKSQASEEKLSQLSSNAAANGWLENALDTLSELSVSDAENNNVVFSDVAKQISQVSSTLTTLYGTADYGDGEIKPDPRDTENGVEMSRETLVAGTEKTKEVVLEEKTISLIELVARGIYQSDPLLRMILIGSETGVFYRYSDYNDYDDDYDHRTKDWYKKAMSSPDTVVWSDAYFETYGHYVVTCSMTYRDENGAIAGVVCADVEIEKIVENVLQSSEKDSS